MVCKKVACVVSFSLILFLQIAAGQSQAPAFQVMMVSSTCATAIQALGCQPGAVPTLFTFNSGTPTAIGNAIMSGAVKSGQNFGTAFPVSILASELNASIATALSVIPISSPASAVITRTDPTTGAELPVSSTLGPILTERAETIGKNKFYVGFSNEDFHFTSLNGQSLRNLSLLDPGGKLSGLTNGPGGATLTTYPSTLGIGADVRLAQNVAFFTYGVTDRFDVSVGLPIVHASITSETANAQVFTGDGLGGASSTNPNCWCLNTYTAGSPPVNLSGLVYHGVINSVSRSNTGFGDMLLRFKGTAIRRRNLAFAAGLDLRLPTGDERNFLGLGTTAIKPFIALSLYTTPLSHGIVFSPHFNLGWQYAGKSVLGGQLLANEITGGPPALYGLPFSSAKGYLPDVFSWAVGTEVALGRRNTVVADILGNQIGWVHGILNMRTSTSTGYAPGCASNCTAIPVSGLQGAGPLSLGQYSGAFGYKSKIAGNLVGTFNMLVRFDDNGLVARAVPLFGLSYTF
jgi:hypothetical protein